MLKFMAAVWMEYTAMQLMYGSSGMLYVSIVAIIKYGST